MKRHWIILVLFCFCKSQTTVHDIGRGEMVLIPGGTFEMGRPDGKPGYDNFPVHLVKIDSFYMDKFEITVGEFKQFLNKTDYDFDWGLWERFFVSPMDNHPMVHVNWYEATAFAKWAGKRLPAEAEWE